MTLRNTGFITLLAGALLLGSAAAGAQGRGGHGGGHGGGYGGGHPPPRAYGGWGPAPYWGGVGIGIGIGVGSVYYGNRYGYGYGYGYPYPWYPGYVVVEPPPVVYYGAPAQPAAPAPPPVPAAPDPVIYPRNGQSPEQTEADRRDCNRWATTQPNAMADATVFQRATLACMDGRGYTVK